MQTRINHEIGIKHNAKWGVSLSNGETLYEGKNDFIEIEGAKSPWQRLNAYRLENRASITSLFIYTDCGKVYNLPSLAKNPKFRAFAGDFKPFDFTLERHLGTNPGSGGTDHFTSICAFYNLNGVILKLSLWVDEKNVAHSRSLLEIVE